MSVSHLVNGISVFWKDSGTIADGHFISPAFAFIRSSSQGRVKSMDTASRSCYEII